MPVQIKVADNAYQSKLITLNGNSLFFTFTFNSRDQRWYVDVVDRNNTDIVNGVKILPAQDLTSKYIDLSTSIGGYLFCIDTRQSGQDVTRLNFGTDKQFQFWYYTNKEIEDILNDSTI